MFLQVSHLNKSYPDTVGTLTAVNDVSFTLAVGEIVGLLGSSGSGKTTLGRLLTGLTASDSGSISLDGQIISFDSQKARRSYYRQVQYIFQEPAASFHPMHTIGKAIMEPLLHNGYSHAQAQKRVNELLQQIGLPAEYADRYIYQISGGEAQRIAIARAISIRPRLLICDEITSSLDTLTQQKIISLLLSLHKQYGTALLFITHDIFLAAAFCRRLLILSKGRLVEAGNTQTILHAPQHPATQQLLEAARNLTI